MSYRISSKLFKCSEIESELQATPNASPFIPFPFQSAGPWLPLLTLKLSHGMKCNFAASNNEQTETLDTKNHLLTHMVYPWNCDASLFTIKKHTFYFKIQFPATPLEANFGEARKVVKHVLTWERSCSGE